LLRIIKRARGEGLLILRHGTDIGEQRALGKKPLPAPRAAEVRRGAGHKVMPKVAIVKQALSLALRSARARARGVRKGSFVVTCAALSACGTDDSPQPADRGDWTEATHGNDTAANYDRLFSMTSVHTIEIAIEAGDFAAMQADLADILADSPGGALPELEAGVMPDAGGVDLATACEAAEAGDACEITTPVGLMQGVCELQGETLSCIPDGFDMGMGGDSLGGAAVDLLSRDPMYVPVEVRHDGHRWLHVGMRYKGNSSLASSHTSGIGKLPFRLDFDQFEAEFPEIDDQRFYGFKKLTFSSNWSDDSQIKEAYVSELLRDRGIPAARCAFYRVLVDVGNGAEYWGLYTVVEDPADGALLDSQLGGRGGNLYKPEGVGADWTEFNREGFEKKTNEDDADWSDIESAITALHADTSDPAAWRERLEATFDVELFLTWLAVNTTIVNWDSYGGMAHNYYLYGAESDPRLRWIPWDHNLSMSAGGIGAGPPTTGTQSQGAAAEVFHESVGSDWPLIQRLLSDPVYFERYRDRLRHALEGLFAEDAAAQRLRELHELVRPHVVGSDGERASHTTISSDEAFLQAIDGSAGLVQHVATRHARVGAALNGE
jgi:spore coat protein H